jgi:hypothetical protein
MFIAQDYKLPICPPPIEWVNNSYLYKNYYSAIKSSLSTINKYNTDESVINYAK